MTASEDLAMNKPKRERTHLNIRIDRDLFDKLTEYGNKTKLVTRLIREFFDKDKEDKEVKEAGQPKR